MQGSSSSRHQRTPACEFPMFIFIPPVLICQASLAHKAQGRACTEPSPCLGVLNRHGSLLQRPQVSPLHLEFISPERIIFQHTRRKKSRRLSGGRCLLSPPLIFQMKLVSLHFTKQGGESGTCPLVLLYQIMSTFSMDSTWSSGIPQQV